ncbi:hypothetical protein N0V88_006913 [Collariella sp. IMI 366227]|nr:hypothetical protein N0V88_006913 [Collariella sp. IMI 366227]
MTQSPINTSFSLPFFALLPAEIRNLIYLEYRKLSPTRQHIVLTETEPSPDSKSSDLAPSQVWSHIPCITDPRAEDVRLQRYGSTETPRHEKKAWDRRLKSQWCLHWACEEQTFDPHPDDELMQRRNAFLSARQSLSQLLEAQTLRDEGDGYIEFLPTLYAHTTFIFTYTTAAEEFLSHYTPIHPASPSAP